ncbi:MAG TPA: ABC transporter permease subunit [Candidatus Limnocylindria bacterium]|nr:ABC transporter permease subunit [Candidatus Limnocylindria bacterium]
MNIVVHELKRALRSWVYFTAGMAAAIALFGSFFHSLRSNIKLMNDMMQYFPAEFKAAFGLADVDLSTAEGYFSFIGMYVVLIGAVYGMKLGVQLLSEEGRRRAADFLLTRPVRRSAVFFGKLGSILVLLVAQNAAVFAAGLAAARLAMSETFDAGLLALLLFSTFFVQLFFVGLGLAVAAAARKIKSVTPIALGVVFFFFIINMVNESLRDPKLAYLTPFAWFKGSAVIAARGYDTGFLLAGFAVFTAFTSLAFLLYQRKDFYAA